MQIVLQKWGNSDGIRIPSNLLKSLNIKTNDKLNIEQSEDKIIISKVKQDKISLREKFENYKGEPLENEFEWDLPQGREIW